jgi:hypothetical protein
METRHPWTNLICVLISYILNQGGVGVRRLIPYVLGVAAAAGAMYLYVTVYVQSYDSLADGLPSGWVFLLLYYLLGASGAVGGLLGLVVAARSEPRSGWGLAFAQGVIATVVPVPVVGLAMGSLPSLLAEFAACALAGTVGAVLSFGLYIADRLIGR